MLPVEIYPIQDAMVLRARGSELLILADHVAALKKLKSAGDFAKYFLDEALVNRPARKLFEAWLRKDGSLWSRIYKTVQTIETSSAQPDDAKPIPKAESAKPAAKEVSETKKTTEVKAKAEKAPAKKEEKKPATKTATKPAAKAETKKAAPKAAAKPAAKTATKAAPKPAAKTAAKKSGKK